MLRNFGQLPQDRRRRFHKCRLGDLEVQVGRVDPARLDSARYCRRQLATSELAARHVDGHETGNDVGPFGRTKSLGTDVQHPPAERDNKARLLCERQEIGRRHEAPLRVLPADQPFVAHDAQVGKLDDGLEERHQACRFSSVERSSPSSLRSATVVGLSCAGSYTSTRPRPLRLGPQHGLVGFP